MAQYCSTYFDEYKFSNYWTITNYKKWEKHYPSGSSLDSPPFSPRGKDSVWVLRLVPKFTRDNNCYCSLRLYPKVLKTSVYADYKLGIETIGGKECNMKEKKDVNLSQGNTFGFGDFIERDDLFDKTNGYLIDNSLTIFCTVFVSEVHSLQNHIGKTPDIPALDSSKQQLIQQLNDTRKKELYTDVTLVAGGKEFKAHKMMLATRSSFFKACFEEHWDQKENRVEMSTDVTCETLEAMLDYIYTGETKIFDSKANQMLPVADEYGLEDLKLNCEKKLSANLEVRNVINTIVLADKHSAAELRKACIDYIVRHSTAVLSSESWKELKTLKHTLELRADITEAIAMATNACS